ncbi:cyclin-dependent kinase G-2-like [Salvia miltiorrhiza]|uniref:cyclin-dependent kinase G-2-like n=1 Tax=Salvia miltiorrhiza TaxID=226208 RepID=UPI0025AD44B5|nr:cyclin-dependent kinase G-2-like [Salvia miltiorrhiza]
MATQICKNNNNGFGHLSKPNKGNYLSVFRGRKTACRSKPAKGIVIKKPAEIISLAKERKRKLSELQCSCLKKRSRDVTIPDCGSVDEYVSLGKISGGSYGLVYKVQHKKTGEIMAMKEEFEGLSPTTITEIDILKSLGGAHPSVVGFKEVAVDEYDGVYVVMEHMETDLRALIKGGGLAISQVKMLMKQLLQGVEFLHENGVMHRDLKPANLLVNRGGELKLKICDFGLSVRFRKELVSSYSPRVGTLWYRAPELLLGEERYSCAVDMWAVGCIMAELLFNKVLFRGESEEDQLHQIYCLLGLPSSAENVSTLLISSANLELSEPGFDLLKGLLTYDPTKRLTPQAALNHVWFQDLISS